VGKAKDIRVEPITSRDASRIIKTLHYSGKVVQNSQVHLGVFLDGRCGGALQFGPSLDKRKIMGLVEGTGWNEFIELNRMALADWLPRNGESRAISVAMKILKKNYPQLKWVVSFADATQCGDGTIYRASGFVLTGIKKNKTIIITKSGLYMTEFAGGCHRKGIPIEGFQLRYIYFLDPTARERLTVPIIPFSEIEKRGASMYKGQKRPVSETVSRSANQQEDRGSIPTAGLLEVK